MTTFDTAIDTTSDPNEQGHASPQNPLEREGSGHLSSPFALSEVTEAEATASPEQGAMIASPFQDGLVGESEADLEDEVGQFLLSEFEDEEFAEALEALADEAAARTIASPALMNETNGSPVLDATEAEHLLEVVGAETEQLLSELERHFAERSVESISDDELDQLLPTGSDEHEFEGSALDEQELFFKRIAKSIRKKVKKIARGARRLVKKGIKFASKFMPLGLIFRRLRPLIKPLLRRVLARAIGKLPRSLRGPARRLAKRYGLREAEFETEFEYLAGEFDAEVVDAMLGDQADIAAFEAEVDAEARAEAAEPNMAEQLDAARLQLAEALAGAEEGETPTEAMEQFVPMALLPIARMGIKIAGRRRVVRFVAGLLARLIKPIVGRQLARPLSMQIADKGLRLLRLEAESGGGDRLGVEALVAATEEALHEVFELPEEWLENEMLLEMAVQDAFHDAAQRHFPDSALRSELAEPTGEDERGVWLMMPRNPGQVYRYKQYSNTIPLRITPRLARSVAFSTGETLDEHLYEAGVDTWPAEGELELYELLPGGEVGHIATGTASLEGGAAVDATSEFHVLDDAGELPVPETELRRRGARASRRRRRLVRIKVRGRAIRRRSPVSIRLDLSGSQPAIRLHVTVGERRAMAIVDHIGRRQHRDVLAAFRRLTGPAVRRVVARRLQAMLRRRQLEAKDGTASGLSDRLFDGLIAALGAQVQSLGPAMSAAAKDPAPGLTLTATFGFASKDALTAGQPNAPTLSVRPGRHRD